MSPLYSHKPRAPLGRLSGMIPEGWDEHHRPVVEQSLKSPGTIHRVTAGPAPFPKPAGWSGVGQIYEGLFRVQQLNRELNSYPGEQPTREHPYLVVAKTDLPALQAGERGDLIRVEGLELRVQRVLFGSHLWEMDIYCTLNLTQDTNPV